jgi:hypothetical protein
VPGLRGGLPAPDGGRPAGPPPTPPATPSPTRAVGVDRLVSANGLIGLAGRCHPVGVHVAGRRLTVRLDRGLRQLVDLASCCAACPTGAPDRTRAPTRRPTRRTAADPSPRTAARRTARLLPRCAHGRQRAHPRPSRPRWPHVDRRSRLHQLARNDDDRLVTEVARNCGRPRGRLKDAARRRGACLRQSLTRPLRSSDRRLSVGWEQVSGRLLVLGGRCPGVFLSVGLAGARQWCSWPSTLLAARRSAASWPRP